VEVRTDTVNGVRLAYAVHPGTGTPIVLVHGVGSSLDNWGDVPKDLAAGGRTVIALDLLGHGQSGAGNGDFSLGSHACAIRDLLDHLAIERVHLVGHSLGGGVSMQFNYQFPQRVESLTLISSGGLGTEVGARLRAASLPGSEIVLRTVTSKPVLRTMTWLSRALGTVGHAPGILSPRAIAKLERLQDAESLTAFLATVRSVVGPQGQRVSALERLEHLDADRVLIIWGDADPMLPVQHGHDARDLMPGSRLVIVPGALHDPHTDDPALVTAELLAHVEAVESRLSPA